MCVGVFKMLIDGQKISGRMQLPPTTKKGNCVFPPEERKGVVSRALLFMFHFTYFSTFFFHEYVVLL